MAIVVPAIVLRSPRDHIAIFAVLATLVGVAVAVVPPIAGALSDRRAGAAATGAARRVALAVDVVALAAMAFSASVGELGAALVTATIALMAAQTIYQVLLPEVVPRHAWVRRRACAAR